MIDAGVIEARPGDADPGAIALDAQAGREVTVACRPTTAEASVRVGLPEPKKKAPAPA